MGVRLLQPTMTAGEVSPSLYGRVDIARYGAGLRRCRNFIVRPYGGVENRTGLRFVADCVGALDHRVVPFVYSTEIAYVLVLGDRFIRFSSGGAEVAPSATAYGAATTYALDQYVTSGGITYRSLQAANTGNTPATSPTWWVADTGLQITTPWTAAQIRAVRYTQSADVLYFTHPDLPPRELRRLTANSFELRLYENKEGPFLDLNNDESLVVSASGQQGTVTLTASAALFTANAVGSLFYLETKDLGQVKPWVVGDRSVTVGALRRSDGKTYKAVTVPSGGGSTWTETGPRQPVHEAGRSWDGTGDTKTNGSQTWTVGVEWEYVDSGYGVVQITAVASATSATGTVTKRLPQQVVGGVAAPTNTWNLTGDGTTKTFSIAVPDAGFGVYSVTIAGGSVQSDPNYVPPESTLVGTGEEDPLGSRIP